MKKLLLLSGLLVFLTASPLMAQHTLKLTIQKNSSELNRLELQALLIPSFQHFTLNRIQVETGYLFDYRNNKKQHYLNVFNSIMAEILLVKVSEEIDMHDYLIMETNLGETRSVFQYNFMRKRTQFYYTSELHKKFWW